MANAARLSLAESAKDAALSRTDVRAFLAVSILALVIRVTFVSLVHPEPVSDFAWYYRHAIQLTQGLGYTTHGIPTAYWPPGWPYALAAVFTLFGPHVYAGELAQAIFNTLTVSLVYLIARRVASTSIALAAALAYAVLPSAIEWTAVLGSEPLYAFLWTLATYIWLRAAPDRLGWLAVSGVVLGAATLVRPTALLAAGVLFLYLCFTASKKNWKTLAIAPLIVACFTAATIAPDLVRNYRVFHTFVLICNTGGTSLWTGNNAAYHVGDVSLHNSMLQKMTDDPRTELEADRLAESMAIAYIRTHLERTAALAPLKLKALYARDDEAIPYAFKADPTVGGGRSIRLLNRIVYYAILVLALAGLLECVRAYPRTGRSAGWVLLLLNILYNTLPFAIMPAFDRYHFATMPYIAVFAGIGAVTMFSRLRGQALAARTT